MTVQGKTVAITGSANGIGRASALKLARAGAGRILLLDIDNEGMSETARQLQELGTDSAKINLDLSDLDAVERWFTTDAEQLGGFDVLYNNAGIVSGAHPFPNAGQAAIQRIVDINFTSMALAIELAAKALHKKGGGTIVNTISTVALGNGFHDIMYAASKAGAHMLVQACAPLQDTLNVRVVGVLPGLVDTPILYKTGGEGVATPWMLDILKNYEACAPGDIAEAVLDLIENTNIPGGSWVAVRREEGKIFREWSDPALA